MWCAAELVKPNQPHKDLPKDAGEECLQRLDQLRNSKGNLHTAEIRRNMQRIMQVTSTISLMLCCVAERSLGVARQSCNNSTSWPPVVCYSLTCVRGIVCHIIISSQPYLTVCLLLAKVGCCWDLAISQPSLSAYWTVEVLCCHCIASCCVTACPSH